MQRNGAVAGAYGTGDAVPLEMADIPNAIGFENQHCGFSSRDLDAVRRFYSEQLGFTHVEVIPPYNSLVVRTGDSSTLGFTGAADLGSMLAVHEASIYFSVKNVDRCYEELTKRGVKFEGPPVDKPWGYRVVVTHDPDGRRILFASVSPPAPDPTPDIAFPSS
jgi:predicted enzyme related to lactoylglutathione lyase